MIMRQPGVARGRCVQVCLLTSVLVGLCGLPALAQSLRDPTQAPAAWQQAGTGTVVSPGAGGRDGEQAPGRMSILVVDGRPHLIQGTRLYAVGQMLGQARIERITETEVWLREGGELRKIDSFAGIRRSQVDGLGRNGGSNPNQSDTASKARTGR